MRSPLKWIGANAQLLASGVILKLDGTQYGANVVDTLIAPVTPAALNIDWSASTTFSKTISISSTFTFSNTASGQIIVVALTTTGSFTATWPAVLWPSGSAPTQTASGTDIYTFVKIGSTIYGSVTQAMA